MGKYIQYFPAMAATIVTVLTTMTAANGCSPHLIMQPGPVIVTPTDSTTTDDQQMYSTTSLIIYYDPEVGKEPLLKAIKERKAEVIYDYSSFTAIAIKIRKDADIHDEIEAFTKVKGVLQVSRDAIMHLD